MAGNAVAYLLNVGKSLGYTGMEIFKENSPFISELAKDAKDAAKASFTAIKDFTYKATKDRSETELSYIHQGEDIAASLFKNLKDDLKSGKWYNTDRAKQAEDAMAKMAGMDLGDFDDFDMDVDFDESEFDTDDIEDDNDDLIESGRRNTQAEILAIDATGSKVANTISNATIESADYIVKNNSLSSKALYNLNSRGFASVVNTINQMNATNAEFMEAVGKPLTEHLQNSYTFFTETTNTLGEIKDLLETISENTAPKESNSTSREDNSFASFVDFEGKLDYKGMFKYTKEQVKSLTSMLDMFTAGGAGGIAEMLKAQSPMQWALKALMKSLVPSRLSKSQGIFDNAIRDLLTGTMYKMTLKDTSIVSKDGLLGQLFGADTVDSFIKMVLPENERKKLRTGNYNKGVISWDGVARKSLVEVIPTTLFKIYSAITGKPEQRYDYERGRFVTVKDIIKNKDDEIISQARITGGDLRDAMIERVHGDEKKEKAIDDYFIYALTHDDFIVDKDKNKRERFKDLKGNAIDPAILDLVYYMTNPAKNEKNNYDMYKMNKFFADRVDAVSYLNNLISEQENLGHDVSLSLYNNSIDKEENIKNLGSTLNGAFRNDTLFYLKGIYENTSNGFGPTAPTNNSNTSGIILPPGVRIGERTTRESNININNLGTMNVDEDDIDEKSDEEHRKEVMGSINKGINEATDKARSRFYNAIQNHIPAPIAAFFGKPIDAAVRVLDTITLSITKFLWGENGDNGLFADIKGLVKDTFKNLTGDKGSKIKNFLFGDVDSDGKRKGGWLSDLYNETVSELKGAGGAIGTSIEEFMGIQNNDLKMDRSKSGRTVYKVRDKLTGKFVTISKAKYLEMGGEIQTPTYNFNGLSPEDFRKDDITKEGAKKRSYRYLVRDKDSGEYINVGSKQYKELLNSLQTAGTEEQDITQNAKGRRVTKTGLVAVSEGEMIIPSEFNPFYHGTNDKSIQLSRESRAIDRYYRGIGRYAEGNVSINNDTEDDGSKRVVKFKKKNKDDESFAGLIPELISVFTNGIDSVRNKFKEITGNEKEDKKSVKKVLDKLDFGGAKGRIGAGALIGAGTGILTGILGGPILSAAVGAAIGWASKSKSVQDWLFGESDENGNRTGGKLFKDPKIATEIYKNMPNIGKGAGVGALGGFLLGHPAIGAVIGGSLSYASASKKAQEWLFGKYNEETEEFEGGSELARKIKSKFPNILGGAALGGLFGPMKKGFGIGNLRLGGLASNIILGGAIGFLTSTDKFHEFIFGKKDDKDDDGLLGKVQKKILDPLDRLATNTGLALKGWWKKTSRRILNWGKRVFYKLERRLLEGKFLRGVGKWIITKLVPGLGKLGFNLTSGIISGLADRREAKNIRKGYDFVRIGYEQGEDGKLKRVKRKATAQERLDAAGTHKGKYYRLRMGLYNDNGIVNNIEGDRVHLINGEYLSVDEYKDRYGVDPSERIAGMNGITTGNDQLDLAARIRNMNQKDLEEAQNIISDPRALQDYKTNILKNRVNTEIDLIRAGMGKKTARKLAAELASGNTDAAKAYLTQGKYAKNADKEEIEKIFNNSNSKFGDIRNANDEAAKRLRELLGDNINIDNIAAYQSIIDTELKSNRFSESTKAADHNKTMEDSAAAAIKLITHIDDNVTSIANGGVDKTAEDGTESHYNPTTGKEEELKIEKNNNGEIEKVLDATDESTQESRKLMDKLNEASLETAKNTRMFASLSNNNDKKEDGEKKKSFFDKIIDFFSNDNDSGFLGKIFKGLKLALGSVVVSVAISKVAKAVSSWFKNLKKDGGDITDATNDTFHDMNENFGKARNHEAFNTATGARIQTDAKGKLIKDEDGNYIDEYGNIVDPDNIQYKTTDTNTATSRAMQTVGRDLVRKGMGMPTTLSLTGKAIKGGTKIVGKWTGLNKVGKGIKNTGNKISSLISSKTNPNGFKKNAAGRWIDKTGKFVKEADVPDSLKRGKLRDKIGAFISKVFDKLAKIPPFKQAASGIAMLKDKVLRNVAQCTDDKVLEEAAAKAASKKLFIALQALISSIDFAVGVDDADSILGIRGSTVDEQYLAGFINAVNKFIPFMDFFLPSSQMAPLVYEFLGPFFGLDVDYYKQRRKGLSDEVAQYNIEHGTNFTEQQYVKEVLGDTNLGDKLKDWGLNLGQNVKDNGFFKGIGKQFKNDKNYWSNQLKKTKGNAGIYAKSAGKTALWGLASLGDLLTGDVFQLNEKVSGMGSGLNDFVSQNDPRYNNYSIAGSSFGKKGCGPAVASMAAANAGKNLSVGDAVNIGKKYQNGGGVSADYFSDALGSQGISTNYTTNKNQMANNILGGGSTILLGRDPYNKSKANSPFGPNGHYVLATGVDKNGNIMINDPELNGPRSYSPSILNSASVGITSGAGAALEDNDIAKKVWGFFTSNGFSPAATAGIMGNLYKESYMDPTTIQGGGRGPAAGIAQWENYNKKSSRWLALDNFAKERGKDWTDLDSQLAFMLQEMSNTGFANRISGKTAPSNLSKAGAPTGITMEEFMKTNDIDLASRLFEAAFERAGKPDMTGRINNAVKYYDMYNSSPYTGVYNASDSNSQGSDSSDSAVDTADKLSLSNIISKIMSAFTFGGSKAASTGITAGLNGVTSGINNSGVVNGDTSYLNLYKDKADPRQLELVKKMDSIRGTLRYSLRGGEQNPDNGVASCASTVGWAYNKILGVNGMSAGSTTQSKDNRFTTIYTNDGKHLLDPNKLMPGDIMYQHWGDNHLINDGSMQHTEMYAGNGKDLSHGGSDKSNPSGYGPVYKDLNDYRLKHTMMVRRYNGFINNDTNNDNIKDNIIPLDQRSDLRGAGSGLAGNRFFSMNNTSKNNSTTASTVNMLTGLADQVKRSADNGQISGEVLQQLILAIIEVLKSISNNTSSIDKIYNVLVEFSNNKATTGNTLIKRQTPTNKAQTDREISDGFKNVVSQLAALAKG